MSEEKFMMISLDDPKMKDLSDVLGNKTCKKIVDYLADNIEASQKDLSLALDIPMNTMDYSVKKLLSSGLIQKRKNFFWSKKGKKIAMYELSNKSIVISPRSRTLDKMKKILPSFMVTLVGSFVLFVYQKIALGAKLPVMAVKRVVDSAVPSVANSLYDYGASDGIAEMAVNEVAGSSVFADGSAFTYAPSPVWVWFLAGGILAIGVYALINWRKL